MSAENPALYIPSNPEDAKKIAAVIDDISDAMTMIEAKRDYIKEAKKALKEEWELTPKAIGAMIKLRHSRSASEYFEEQEELEALYGTVFPGTAE